VLGVGFLAGVLLVALLALWSARSVVRNEHAATASTRTTLALTAGMTSALPPAVAIGFGNAVDTRRGRSSASPWPSIGGALVAVVGIVSIGIVAASMRNLEREPRVYGYNWDAHAIPDTGEPGDTASECNPAPMPFVRERVIDAAAALCSDVIEINGYPVTGVGLTQLKRRVTPTVLEGRAPSRIDEVALATKTFDHVHASIGDKVAIAGPGGTESYRVVGRVVMPSLERPTNENSDVQAIADGAAFTGKGLRSIASNDLSEMRVLLRWRDGVDAEAAATTVRDSGAGKTKVRSAVVPLEVDRIEQIHVLPWLLGAFVALIGVLGLGYGLVMSVRRRSRELAVLKTIGFRHRQIMGTVATQATVYGAVGLVVGVPVGFFVGRAAWDEIAGSAGFEVVSVLSWWFVVVVALGALAIANAVAWFPGRRAARLQPAVVLRSE
jgi:hypothetical protein